MCLPSMLKHPMRNKGCLLRSPLLLPEFWKQVVTVRVRNVPPPQPQIPVVLHRSFTFGLRSDAPEAKIEEYPAGDVYNQSPSC